MKKIINPVMCNIGNRNGRGFCEIEYNESKGTLSIHGVIAPYSSGNCGGSCGQCTDEIREGNPIEKDGWTREMVNKFCDIWDRWHLNDMHPYCSHQKELGWDELSSKEVNIYHYTTTREVYEKKREAESEALKALHEGKAFTPSEEQVFFSTFPYSLDTWKELTEEDKMYKYYEPKKKIISSDTFIETKALGCLHPKDHPDGLLTKECPVCGYKYGTSWKKEEVPQEVIDWLFNLPDTKVKPAWV